MPARTASALFIPDSLLAKEATDLGNQLGLDAHPLADARRIGPERPHRLRTGLDVNGLFDGLQLRGRVGHDRFPLKANAFTARDAKDAKENQRQTECLPQELARVTKHRLSAFHDVFPVLPFLCVLCVPGGEQFSLVVISPLS